MDEGFIELAGYAGIDMEEISTELVTVIEDAMAGAADELSMICWALRCRRKL